MALQDGVQQVSPRAIWHRQEASVIADLQHANQSLQVQVQQLSAAAERRGPEPSLIADLERVNQSLELHCHANNVLIDELKVHNQQLADELAHAKHQSSGDNGQPEVRHRQLNRQLQL